MALSGYNRIKAIQEAKRLAEDKTNEVPQVIPAPKKNVAPTPNKLVEVDESTGVIPVDEPTEAEKLAGKIKQPKNEIPTE